MEIKCRSAQTANELRPLRHRAFTEVSLGGD
jgi:hypothetical protein